MITDKQLQIFGVQKEPRFTQSVEEMREVAKALDMDERETENYLAKSESDAREVLSPAQIQAIHIAMQRLADMCDGAKSQDGTGFDKIDTHIGKSLAECRELTARQAALGKKIVRKYRRQLGEELMVAINGEAGKANE